MDMLAIKRRGVAAITVMLILLVVVIFLISAGKIPVLLILAAVISAIYAGRTLWQLKKAGQVKM